MKRLFIGIPIAGDNAQLVVSEWHDYFSFNSNRLAWTKPSNWHITLVFLGSYPESDIDQLNLIINEAFNDSKAYQTQLNGVGVFPDKRKPNVLWLGLQNIHPLEDSYEKLVHLLQKNNFIFDQKPLRPHLTVARIKVLSNRISFNELLDQYKDFNFGQTEIDRVVLYESISTTDGVVYIPLYEKVIDKN